MRETFVLGAERLEDEAELDLRNEAEADREPKSELDQTAAAEPAIFLPQEAVGPPVGARDLRAKASASAGLLWRPRPPLAALILGAATVCAAVVVLRGAHGDESESSLGRAAAPAVSAPASGGDQASLGGRVEHDGTAHPPSSQDSSVDAPPAERPEGRRGPAQRTSPAPVDERDPVESIEQPSSPLAQPSPPPFTAPGSPSPPEPVQSAAAVRQEFGP